MKMNLSRAAKKFRAQVSQEPEAPTPANAQKKNNARPTPAPMPVLEPVVQAVEPVLEPVPEPVAAAEAVEPAPVPVARPKKGWPVKAKRPRFVREKTERRERPMIPALPTRSTRPAARLLTKNLALPPKDDTPGAGRS